MSDEKDLRQLQLDRAREARTVLMIRIDDKGTVDLLLDVNRQDLDAVMQTLRELVESV